MRLPLFSLLALALVTGPAALAAQDGDPHHSRGRGGLREVSDDAGKSRRQGFWLSLGLGVGQESFDARDGLGWSDGTTGGVGAIKLGGTVSRSLLLGVEAQAWAKEFNYAGYDRALGSVMGIAQWYPAPRSDFWLRGGLGWAVDQLDEHPSSNVTISTTKHGTAWAVGLGYDVPVGRKISLTPNLDFVGQHYDTHSERIVTLGLGVTFH